MTYLKEQMIHSLSFISNAAFGLEFNTKDSLDSFVKEILVNEVVTQKAFNGFIGTWEMVWGPVVYSHDSTSSFARADNTMAAYYNSSEKLIVIAIAGTNTVSSFGWVVEDFNVGKTAVWSSISGTGKGYISQGTADGLNILLSMKDGANNCVSSLKEFIANHDVDEVAVTGHSLGGALSPALALYLFNKKSDWTGGKKVKVSAYPTAGPTIGTNPPVVGFVKYYESLIGTGDDQIDYQSRVNPLDIVPKAWNGTDLGSIPTLYQDNIKPTIDNTVLGTLTLGASLKRISSLYILHKYKQITYSTLSNSAFDTATDNAITSKFAKLQQYQGLYIPEALQAYLPYLEYISRFLAQAAYQHTTAYNTLLNINDLMKKEGPYSSIRDSVIQKYQTAGKIVKELSYVQQAVKAGTGFDIDMELKATEELAQPIA